MKTKKTKRTKRKMKDPLNIDKSVCERGRISKQTVIKNKKADSQKKQFTWIQYLCYNVMTMHENQINF